MVLEPSSNSAEGTDLDFADVLSGFESFTPKDNADQDGLYSIAVTPGTYDVSFNPPSSTGLAAKSLDDVTLFASTTLPTVQLEVGRVVSGIVKNGSGTPLAGVDLDFLISVGGQEIVTNGDNTNALGAFSVLVPSRTYDVEIINPGAAPLFVPTAFTFNAPTASPVLTVERTGPLATDILLQWSSTGQPSYTVLRSDDPAAFAGAPQIIDVVPGTSLRDDGAASPFANEILFYVVH